MVDKPKGTDAVGYGRPPAESRFVPGKSGNPSGRPKAALSFMGDLVGELTEEVAVAGQSGQMSAALMCVSHRLICRRNSRAL